MSEAIPKAKMMTMMIAMLTMMTVSDMMPKARFMTMKTMMTVSPTMMMTVAIKMLDTNDDDSNAEMMTMLDTMPKGKIMLMIAMMTVSTMAPKAHKGSPTEKVAGSIRALPK